jgi:hypothetical protein
MTRTATAFCARIVHMSKLIKIHPTHFWMKRRHGQKDGVVGCKINGINGFRQN